MLSLRRPPVVYPQSVKAQYAPSSRGSFTPVYVVLGIIGALTLAACFVGRALARRCLRPRRDKRYVAEGEIEMVVPAVNFGAGAGVGGIKQQLTMKHSGSDLQESAAAGTGSRVNFARHDSRRRWQVDPPLALPQGRCLESRISAAFPVSLHPKAEASVCCRSLLQVTRRGELLCGIDAADAQCHGFRVDDVDAHDFAQGLWVAVGSALSNIDGMSLSMDILLCVLALADSFMPVIMPPS
ncbi:hypothetical protein ZIOFF_053105 [Zingiber officinale]|uniref:Uncharacterized protein n=1 Tax=Zingiber officinale TaxID=94328 RepID=A0A8J5FDZ6_ZINOF|nr:hypothetical protein ZIOFF_053105 [Zingiber officinale]